MPCKNQPCNKQILHSLSLSPFLNPSPFLNLSPSPSCCFSFPLPFSPTLSFSPSMSLSFGLLLSLTLPHLPVPLTGSGPALVRVPDPFPRPAAVDPAAHAAHGRQELPPEPRGAEGEEERDLKGPEGNVAGRGGRKWSARKGGEERSQNREATFFRLSTSANDTPPPLRHFTTSTSISKRRRSRPRRWRRAASSTSTRCWR